MSPRLWWLLGGTALLLAVKQSSDVQGEAEDALTSGGTLNVRLTGYWPYVQGLNAAERLMEGGTKDRKGRPIYTLEMHLADPQNCPWVSVSGDYTVWPDGQRIVISAWPDAIFRVVDTGQHFYGAKKVYRVLGREPLDIAVDGPDTYVPHDGTTATIVRGDNFQGGDVKASGLLGQSLV